MLRSGDGVTEPSGADGDAPRAGDRPVSTGSGWIGSPARLAFGVFLAAAGALLVLEHRAHLLGAWLLLLFLAACLAAHLFMHRRHGGRGDREGAGHGR